MGFQAYFSGKPEKCMDLNIALKVDDVHTRTFKEFVEKTIVSELAHNVREKIQNDFKHLKWLNVDGLPIDNLRQHVQKVCSNEIETLYQDLGNNKDIHELDTQI